MQSSIEKKIDYPFCGNKYNDKLGRLQFGFVIN